MLTKVRVIGDSLQISLPKQVLCKVGWRGGQEIDVSVKGSTVILSSTTPQPASLEKLTALVHEEVLALCEGDEAAKKQWMESRIPILAGRTPNEMLHSAADIESLRVIIKKLDHGSFP